VLYHLFEGFSLIGGDKIEVIDIFAGIGSFFANIVGAPCIGILLGFLGGFLSRFTHHVRVMEPLIVVVICYTSFLIPEMFRLSGILGLAAIHNMSHRFKV
jgi:NhaP-type Na+/H+ or K+/H+ antiporter